MIDSDIAPKNIYESDNAFVASTNGRTLCFIEIGYTTFRWTMWLRWKLRTFATNLYKGIYVSYNLGGLVDHHSIFSICSAKLTILRAFYSIP